MESSRFMLLSVLMAVAVTVVGSTCAIAMTEEGIETAIQRGLSATEVAQAPAFLKAGTKFPKGSFGRSVFLGTSEAPYLFLIRSCKQWVANEAFRSKMDNKEPDRDVMRKQCLGQDRIRVAVVTNAAANEIASQTMGYYPVPSQPITSLALEVDGAIIPPSSTDGFDMFGKGNATVTFDPENVAAAKAVYIVATVASEYQLRVKIPQGVLAQLF